MKISFPIYKKLRTKWVFYKLIELLLYATGFSILIISIISLFYVFTLLEITIILASVFIALLIALIYKSKIFSISEKDVARHLNISYEEMEESGELLLESKDSLSLLGRLQRDKIGNYLSQIENRLTIPHHVLKALILCMLLIASSWLLYHLDALFYNDAGSTKDKEALTPDQKAMDQLMEKLPEITSAIVIISPPPYTNLKQIKSGNMNIEAPEGSGLRWQLRFKENVEKVFLLLHSGDTIYFNHVEGNEYQADLNLEESGIYNIQYAGLNGKLAISDYYKMLPFIDQAPSVVINNLAQYTAIDYDSVTSVQVEVALKDDYGIADAYIIATVSRGSGESVKFREQKLTFDENFFDKKDRYVVNKSLNFKALDMAPGDELYFYIAARDNKLPIPNTTKTATYFIQLADTSRQTISTGSGAGVDLMPEYFRSQRQIIIDTERIIRERKSMTDSEVKEELNTLGIDQKLLRLRYGQFLGEEFESSAGGFEVEQSEKEGEGSGTHTDHEGHDHESPVDEGQRSGSNPLTPYIHAHDSREEATFFDEAIKTKLKSALAQMWEAELRLRTYRPKEALPYEYKALELIKEVQQQSRVYVERIGFEPPVLKPREKRLTGELEDIENLYYKEKANKPIVFPLIRQAINRIEQIKIHGPEKELATEDKILLEKAGTELAEIALAQPGNFLITLQNIRKLADGEIELSQQRDYLHNVQNALWSALPEEKEYPYKTRRSQTKLIESYLQEVGDIQ